MLLQEIREVPQGSIVLRPDDPDAEFENTWWLGASPQERLGLSVDEVVAAFEETAGMVRRQVDAMGYRGTATFYVWHDGDAGQLRCSTRSCPPTRLPFDGDYFTTRDLGTIVTEFLSDGEPGFVRDLKPADLVAPSPQAPLPVWTVDVSVATAAGG
ncbi:hypothetical protein [Mangrovihabitans endophyticus]|uniref:hypothetical protein n=1 Tax=Mangrovihabitans endophyticus TaxID=1751298 RepID=UPI001E29B5DB|nr:hypothetical protein [Mangrovihabitans endophyticus]